MALPNGKKWTLHRERAKKGSRERKGEGSKATVGIVGTDKDYSDASKRVQYYFEIRTGSVQKKKQ